MKIFVFSPMGKGNGDGMQVLLSLPDSSLVKNGNPVFVPDFDNSFSADLYLAIKISRLGKSIARKFAYRYYEDGAPAFCLTADNLLSELRAKGLPWTPATAFDKSCPLGEFSAICKLLDDKLILEIDGIAIKELTLPSAQEIDSAIVEASRNNTLKMGDLILVPVTGLEKIRLSPDSNIRLLHGEKTVLEMPVR